MCVPFSLDLTEFVFFIVRLASEVLECLAEMRIKCARVHSKYRNVAVSGLKETDLWCINPWWDYATDFLAKLFQ